MALQAIQLGCVRGDWPLFGGVDFALGAGEALRVAGANGSGKTSLLRMLAGLSSPASGELRWHGLRIGAARAAFHRDLVYVGHANGVKDDLSACENLALACALGGGRVSAAQVRGALEQQGLGRVADIPVGTLSQGQRKRVALARLRLATAPLWILDEAFTALDQSAVADLCATLDAHLARGGMLVYTTHQEVGLAARRHQRLDLDRCQPC